MTDFSSQDKTIGTTDEYPARLHDYVLESCCTEERFHFIQFEYLQRLNIVQLQNKLARIKSRVLSGEQMSDHTETLHETIHAYANAVEDYEKLHNMSSLPHGEMTERSLRLKRYFPEIGNLPHAPFASHYNYASSASVQNIDSLRDWLRLRLPVRITYSREESLARADEYSMGHPPNKISLTVDSIARFLVASVGGLFLLVPMLIMLFEPSRQTSVATVSIAVLTFSIALAFGIKASNAETLASTATYAAFLVVFVGSSSS